MHFHRFALQLGAAALAIATSVGPYEPAVVEDEIMSVNITTRARAPNRCYAKKKAIHWQYDIIAEDVNNISDYCGGLWDNMDGVDGCLRSRAYCGGLEADRTLYWHFRVPLGCNPGMIEAIWWEATRNKYGVINC